jgi:hypothetical protein
VGIPTVCSGGFDLLLFLKERGFSRAPRLINTQLFLIPTGAKAPATAQGGTCFLPGSTVEERRFSAE